MASTIIGKSLVIEGEMEGQEEMVIMGTVRGKVATSEDLVLEAGSELEADVVGANVTISGHVNGTVVATGKLELASGARLVGDVKAARIRFAEGATFKGNVDMDL